RLLFSPVHVKEIEAIPDTFERIELQTVLDGLGESISVNKPETRKRAEELVKMGFGMADAAHISFAEQSSAHFISCDDMLIKKCLRHKINVWCGNPIAFCQKEGLK
ncbi:MAG TPA: hypothetical protein VI387_09715, partial [Candidatus Brocadiales bacterium]|nr:hypothetical protein [Candidatus Brocadiales bacterium]